MNAQRSVLRKMTRVLDSVSPGVKRVLAEETRADIDDLVAEGNRVLG
jgi:hypothetical protein